MKLNPAEKYLAHLAEVENRVDTVGVRVINGRILSTSCREGENGVEVYEITRNDYLGCHICTCPSFKYQKGSVKNHWCKHLEKAARLGLIERPENKVLGLS